jgi:glucosyl-dolichyl phosphate glucuronosyltransferase
VPPVQILVVVDHNDTLRDRLTRHSPDLKIVDSSGVPGLADARNTGVALATGDVVAFLDDDAVAAPDWLEHMLAAYLDGTVLGVGGRVEPAWDQA